MDENRNEGCGELLQHKQTEGSEYGLNVVFYKTNI